MTTDITETLNRVVPGLVKMLDERHELTLDLYRLALKGHITNNEPCDEDYECPDCTLLVIAAQELGLPDPFVEGTEG